MPDRLFVTLGLMTAGLVVTVRSANAIWFVVFTLLAVIANIAWSAER